MSDELTKPMHGVYKFYCKQLQNKHGRIQPENILKNSFCSKMFERKMIQSSVDEPAENKSFSSVDVNCTIGSLA